MATNTSELLRSLTDQDVIAVSRRLYDDLDQEKLSLGRNRHLAHYTSIAAFEGMLRSNEVWFSHPLLMNDHEEVAYGLKAANDYVTFSGALQEVLGERFRVFEHAWMRAYIGYFGKEWSETFIFSASAIERDDVEGDLTMWRAYGGDGSGVALVFDTSQLEERADSPLLLYPVNYISKGQRIFWLQDRCQALAEQIMTLQPDDKGLETLAFMMFERIKIAAIFSKHVGFDAEREWRMVYVPARDPARRVEAMLSYHNGPHGIEPKLKYKISPGEMTAPDLSFEKITRIILGPTPSSPLAGAALRLMIKDTGKAGLVDRVHESTIPYRPRLAPG